MSIYPIFHRAAGVRRICSDRETVPMSATESQKHAIAQALAERVVGDAITFDGPGNYKMKVIEQTREDVLGHKYIELILIVEKESDE